nr:cysteine desulfurase 1, chloroplastic [Tanacetum cinerariifolium]
MLRAGSVLSRTEPAPTSVTDMPLISPWRADFPAIAALQRQGQTYLDSAGSAGQIVFTHGATSAFNLLAYGLEHLFEAGDEIVVSALEHHANLLPWQQLALRRGLKLVVLPLTDSGVIDIDVAAGLITSRTRLLAVSQLSNVLGTWQPIEPLVALARANGALSVIDGAQGVVHGRHDVQQIGCDFYVFSGHKLYGPDGVGVLFGRNEALAQLKHWQFGGEMVLHTGYQTATFRPAPLGFEAGTPAIGAVIGLGATLDYLNALTPSAVEAFEAHLHEQLRAGLLRRDGVRLLGDPHVALASFTVEGVHNADLAHLLTEQGIARAGTVRGDSRFTGALQRFRRPGAIFHRTGSSAGAFAMTLPSDAQTALETFNASLSWEQRARLLMQWGERLPAMRDEEKTDAHRVDGCESKVWLAGELSDGHWQFRAASDARLIRAGTPAIGAVIGLGATLDYLNALTPSAVEAFEAHLHERLRAGLMRRDGVRLLGDPQVALASFVVEGVHNADLAHLLTEQGIAVRAG